MSGRTPGWNDPPPLTYDPKLCAPPAGRRNLLNKRVGYSLSTPGNLIRSPGPTDLPNSSVSPIQAGVASLDLGTPLSILTPIKGELGLTPPPPPSTGLRPSGAQREVEVSPSDTADLPVCPELSSSGDSEDQRKQVGSLLNECFNKYKITLQKKVIEDVQKRLSLLDSMWQEGKFDNDIQLKLLTLSKALNDGDHAQAFNIHQALVVNHPSLVVSWMVGVKHLILQIKNSQESVPVETTSCVENFPEEQSEPSSNVSQTDEENTEQAC